MRQQIAERFLVAPGTVHDRPVGPHARPMYQIRFDVTTFATLVPRPMLNRSGLPVRVHPDATRGGGGHLVRAQWLGEPLPIVDAERQRDDAGADAPRPKDIRATRP